MSNVEQLVNAWGNVFNGAERAIEWVEETKSQSQRLETEADGLTLELRRLRNTATRLGRSSSNPVTAGFFGLSQAGKSYLISALAADEQGKLQTEFDNKILDFVEHINPEGGGKEATGLVTRFSRRAEGGIEGFPLKLQIFSEVEVIKILVNSYSNDFDKEKLEYVCDQQNVNEALKKVVGKASNKRISGLNEDNIVDLQDYVMDNFGKSLSVLNAGYWAKAVKLAPKLAIEDRATLFSILWGEIPEFSHVYIELAKTLAKLGNPNIVYAPLTAVVKEKEGGGISKADSIMNVDMVERFETNRDEDIQVCAQLADEIGSPVTISLAQLTILTAELVFPLINKTRVPVVENIDLLDFPGYRGRLKITKVTADNPVSQLLLRGKVAYLFERYTDSQEMNILIMCTPSNTQSEVNDVGPVLERWINKTQGESPEIRQGRKAGLLWAVTKFDIRIQDKLNTTEENLKISWGSDGLLKQTILERFGNFEWFKDWSAGKPFDNMFLVRKPGFRVPFLDVEGNSEVSINASEKSQLDLMKSTFINDRDIQRHFANAPDKWDAMLKLNDGGMQGISDYLETISSPEVKQQRIVEQLNQAIDTISQRFESWYQRDGAEEVNKKRALGQTIVKALSERSILLGELQRLLQLPKETIFSLYHSTDLDEIGSEEQSNGASSEPNMTADMGFDFGGDFDLFSEPDNTLVVSEEKVEKPTELKSRFVQAVFKTWVEHMRGLSGQDNLMRFFRFNIENRKIIDDLVGEIITAATRLKLQQQLTESVLKNESAGYKRDQLVERQVFTVYTQITDFIAWLGFSDQAIHSRPKSRVSVGNAIFESNPLEMVNGLPKLNDQTGDFTRHYLFDWFIGFGAICEQNAGHSAGREIDAVSNAKLGDVLNQFMQAKVN